MSAQPRCGASVMIPRNELIICFLVLNVATRSRRKGNKRAPVKHKKHRNIWKQTIKNLRRLLLESYAGQELKGANDRNKGKMINVPRVIQMQVQKSHVLQKVHLVP